MTEQSSLFVQAGRDDSPGRTRRRDHATSRAGADSVAYRAGSQKARLLAEYRGAGPEGLSDEEAAKAAGLLASCYWKRCGELRADGMIVATGETRTGAAGVSRIVSRVTILGYTSSQRKET
jgi:hypothetical protein